MSFRDLVNGKSSDLELPVDSSPIAHSAAGIATAAAVTVATAAAAFLVPGGIGGKNIGMGASIAYRQWKGGSERSEEAKETNERNRRTRIQLGIRYFYRLIAVQGPSPSLYFKIGQAEAALKNTKRALKSFQEAIALDPENTPAYIHAGLMHSQLGQIKDAISLLEKARAVSATNVKVNLALAALYEKQSEVQKANECWEAISTSDATLYEPWMRQGQYHAQRKEFQKAKRCFEAAHKLNAAISLPWQELVEEGNVFGKAGLFGDADEKFAQAIMFNPEYAPAYKGRAQCAMSADENATAANFLTDALRLGLTDSDTYMLAAEIAERLDDVSSRNRFWVSAFEVNPFVKVPWVIELDRARIAIDAQQYASALEHLEQAKNLYARWPAVDELVKEVESRQEAQKMSDSGNRAFAEGDAGGAIELWLRSLKHEENATVRMKLGGELADMGRTEDALLHFREAARVGHPLAEKALRMCQAYHDFEPTVGPG